MHLQWGDPITTRQCTAPAFLLLLLLLLLLLPLLLLLFPRSLHSFKRPSIRAPSTPKFPLIAWY
jgi:hypothetical protein